MPLMPRRARAATTGRTLGALLRRRAAESPDAPLSAAGPVAGPTGGAATGPTMITYGALDLRARAVAAFLGAVVPPGSRVLLAHVPGPGADFAGALFGCWYAGMTAVPLPAGALAGGAQLRDAVRRAAPEAVLAAPALAAVVRHRFHGGEVFAASDGSAVDGEPVGSLARRWLPLGVLPSADALVCHTPEGDCEAPFTHADVLRSLSVLAHTARQGMDREQMDWLAHVHGLGLVWEALLAVHQGHGHGGPVRPAAPWWPPR
ncbi:hypothetical protein GCM10010406_48540 [Streptomyces thermolineatus]|uniref:AMP-dependent synthetase/ligase domain-containing protein n=2 Tax=Streptomyces thermolineatus TaxID=44033 RepID=A0ABN3MPV8_9ACTN